MRRRIRLNSVLFVLIATIFLTAVSYINADISEFEDQATNFIQQAFPADLSKYTVTLTKSTKMTYTDIVQYTLDSENSTVVVNCFVKDNILTGCSLTIKKGQIISNKSYPSTTDAAKGFLEKYQSYTKMDSANMIDMLSNADITKNSSRIIGNTVFAIDNMEEWGAKNVKFTWAYFANGANYTSLSIGFKDGVFYSLYDDRALYSIGDTTVNISRDQAIDIAMKYIDNYSYDMFNDTKVSGFNITEERTFAELTTTSRNTKVLNPCWTVKLYLNQTYPGNVKGFVIHIWAKSGEIFDLSKIATGGDESNTRSTIDPIESAPPAIADNSSPLGVQVYAAIVVALAVIIASIALIIRKRG